jgi:hypothetical protein
MDRYYIMNAASKFETRQATVEEVQVFGGEWTDVNWGIWYDGEMAALFQADNDGDGWLNVHAKVARRKLHPAVTKIYAKAFSDRLLELGAIGLKAEIEPRNRAAIQMAKAAGYREVNRNDEWVLLVREPDGKEETTATTV